MLKIVARIALRMAQEKKRNLAAVDGESCHRIVNGEHMGFLLTRFNFSSIRSAYPLSSGDLTPFTGMYISIKALPLAASRIFYWQKLDDPTHWGEVVAISGFSISLHLRAA